MHVERNQKGGELESRCLKMKQLDNMGGKNKSKSTEKLVIASCGIKNMSNRSATCGEGGVEVEKLL